MTDSMLSHGVPKLTPTQRRRAAAEVARAYDSLLPDYETDKQGWESEMFHRMEGWATKQGFVNKSTRTPLIQKALTHGPDIEKVWDVFMAACEPRIKIFKDAQKKQAQTAIYAEHLKPMLIEAGLAKCCVHPEFRKILNRFYSLEEALKWGAYFTTDYKDNPAAANDRLPFEPVVVVDVPAEGSAPKVVAEKPIVSAQTAPVKAVEQHKDNEMASTKPAQNDWIMDPNKQREFSSRAKAIYDKYAVPTAERERITLASAGNVKSLYETSSKAGDLLKKIDSYCEQNYPIKSTEPETHEDAPDSNETEVEATNDTADTTAATPASQQPRPPLSATALAIGRTSGCVTTTILVNGLEFKVTAFEGESAHDVAQNITNMYEGLREFAKQENISEFGGVADGRDAVTVFKREGKFLSTPEQKRVAPAPESSGSSKPGASVPTDGGEYKIVQVKKIEDEGKTRYEFFNQADSKDCVLKTYTTSVFDAACDVNSLKTGTRRNVSWIVRWEPGAINARSNKPYRDVVSVMPA